MKLLYNALRGIQNQRAKESLNQELEELQKAYDNFQAKYKQYMSEVLVANKLNKIVRRKFDGKKGILKIIDAKTNDNVPAQYAFYPLRKNDTPSERPADIHNCVVEGITVFYEPVK